MGKVSVEPRPRRLQPGQPDLTSSCRAHRSCSNWGTTKQGRSWGTSQEPPRNPRNRICLHRPSCQGRGRQRGLDFTLTWRVGGGRRTFSWRYRCAPLRWGAAASALTVLWGKRRAPTRVPASQPASLGSEGQLFARAPRQLPPGPARGEEGAKAAPERNVPPPRGWANGCREDGLTPAARRPPAPPHLLARGRGPRALSPAPQLAVTWGWQPPPVPSPPRPSARVRGAGGAHLAPRRREGGRERSPWGGGGGGGDAAAAAAQVGPRGRCEARRGRAAWEGAASAGRACAAPGAFRASPRRGARRWGGGALGRAVPRAARRFGRGQRRAGGGWAGRAGWAAVPGAPRPSSARGSPTSPAADGTAMPVASPFLTLCYCCESEGLHSVGKTFK